MLRWKNHSVLYFLNQPRKEGGISIYLKDEQVGLELFEQLGQEHLSKESIQFNFLVLGYLKFVTGMWAVDDKVT